MKKDCAPAGACSSMPLSWRPLGLAAEWSSSISSVPHAASTLRAWRVFFWGFGVTRLWHFALGDRVGDLLCICWLLRRISISRLHTVYIGRRNRLLACGDLALRIVWLRASKEPGRGANRRGGRDDDWAGLCFNASPHGQPLAGGRVACKFRFWRDFSLFGPEQR